MPETIEKAIEMMPIKAYELIEDEFKSIYRSRLQVQILLSIRDQKKNLEQLRQITGSSSQAIIPKLRKLESKHFVEEEGYYYRLTQLGKILTTKIHEAIMTLGVIAKFENFWLNHQLDGIPEPLLNDIGDLFNSEVIRDTKEDVFKAFGIYMKHLGKAQQIFVVSSFTSPELIDAVTERLSAGIPAEIVITRELFGKLYEEPYIEKLNKMIQFPNLKLKVTQEYVRVGFTVTDEFLSMGLYKKDGMLYDFSEDFFSFNEKAIKWGKRFFQYYKDRSVNPLAPES